MRFLEGVEGWTNKFPPGPLHLLDQTDGELFRTPRGVVVEPPIEPFLKLQENRRRDPV